MIKLFLTSSLLAVSLFANYAMTYQPEVIRADFASQNTAKYRLDNIPFFTLKSLQDKKVFLNKQTLIRKYESKDFGFDAITKAGACDDLVAGFTGTIFEVNLKNGHITCMFSETGDLYNPIGLFNVYYPEVKAYYSLDREQAKIDKTDLIKSAEAQFKPLYDKRKELSAENFNLENDTYLNVTELLTASILTDTDVIDIQATSASGKLQLKDSFTSKFVTDRESGTSSDNSEYILTDSETIFSVYSNLSDLSMGYLIMLVALFGIHGVGRAFLSPFADKLEKKQSSDKHIPWGAGLVAGVLLFFPVSDHDDIHNPSGENVAQFNIMKTRYQDFEKTGYYFFTEWANDAARSIIDVEMDSIIDKSGIGTKDQIINTYAGLVLENKLNDFYTNFNSACENQIYKFSDMVNYQKKKIYSEAEYMTFPVSESWAWVSKLVKPGAKYYYDFAPLGLTMKSGYSDSVISSAGKLKDGELDSFYPLVSMSSCGKAFLKEREHSEKAKLYEQKLNLLSAKNSTDSAKINMLMELIGFQYELDREWGYLSILGLPVTKMQTEYIGGLYETRNSEVLEALNKDITEDSWGGITHTIMSSIPYMFVPGAGTVFKASLDATKGVKDAVDDTALGWVGGKFGAGILSSLVGTATGMSIGYQVSKTVLELTPIVGIVIIGLVRFIIIMVKIFSFHFASLFLMPVMFAKENIQAISRFTMKIFATMLELPIFVLAVWLAITANSLIHNIGDIFSKRIILGMLKNNETQYAGVDFSLLNNAFTSKLKIYIFDGFMEIAISVFAIIIIYKLIITLHNTLLEVLEIQGSQSLDNSLESMKNEAGGWGSRI